MANMVRINGGAINGGYGAAFVQEIVATLANTTATMAGAHEPFTRIVFLAAGGSQSVQTSLVQEIMDSAEGSVPVETFYSPAVELSLSATSELEQRVVAVIEGSLTAGVSLTSEVTTAVMAWLSARAADPVSTDLSRYAELLLEAAATVTSMDALAATVQEVTGASDNFEFAVAVKVLDAAAVALIPSNTLAIEYTETLEATAGDSVEVLGRYMANVRDMAGAWLVFKVSGELQQGWVMNVEGARPFSQYEGFNFNSMARIGDAYLGASDEGLYALAGATDGGEPISAHVRSMMLDFDTSRQKRVVAAYLGYTSDGAVVLKVRSVDEGKLVEHWYQATTLTADAPRAGYTPLGRGLKSRYWQFELSNVDGADFEIDKLDLQPIQLNRRV